MNSIVESALSATAMLIAIAAIIAAMAGWMWLIASGHTILAALVVVALLWVWMFSKFQSEAHRNDR